MRTILFGACALVLLSACGKREPAVADPAPVVAQADGAQSAAGADAAEAAGLAAAEKLRDSYRARLVPLLAGSYAGTCQIARGSDSEHLTLAGGPARDRIEVAPDGKVNAIGMQRDLMRGTDTLMINRTLEGGKGVSSVAVTGASEPAWTLTVQSGREDKVQLTGDTSAIDCGTLDGAVTLRDQPLWPVVAGFFSASAATMVCTEGGVTHSKPAVRPNATGIAIGGRQFAFDQGLHTEMAGFDKAKGLSYAVDYDNGIKLLVMLDREGKLSQLITAGQQDALFDCQREGTK